MKKKPNTLKLSLTFTLLSFLLIISGCGSNFTDSTDTGSVSHNGKDLFISLKSPPLLTQPPIAGLGAYLTIDGGSPITLSVAADNTISGNIPDVAAGSHVIVITYYVDTLPGQVVLATVTKTVTVSAGQTTTVGINDTDLVRNIDDDNDGYTNLAEVRIGTDALDRYSVPAGESPLSILANGAGGSISSTTYIIKFTLGEGVAGSSSSTNYKINAGFKGFE